MPSRHLLVKAQARAFPSQTASSATWLGLKLLLLSMRSSVSLHHNAVRLSGIRRHQGGRPPEPHVQPKRCRQIILWQQLLRHSRVAWCFHHVSFSTPLIRFSHVLMTLPCSCHPRMASEPKPYCSDFWDCNNRCQKLAPLHLAAGRDRCHAGTSRTGRKRAVFFTRCTMERITIGATERGESA